MRRLPGVERLLRALEGLPPAYLVGGTVRDLLLERPPAAHLDLAIEGDARSVARALADRLSGTARETASRSRASSGRAATHRSSS